MQTVIATNIFLAQAKKAGITEEEVTAIADAIAGDPQGGDVIAGTGGARKVRHPAPGKGKSGGYRTIHYRGGADIPVFLLAIYTKGRKTDLTKAERNELAAILPKIGDAYRQSTRARTTKRKK